MSARGRFHAGQCRRADTSISRSGRHADRALLGGEPQSEAGVVDLTSSHDAPSRAEPSVYIRALFGYEVLTRETHRSDYDSGVKPIARDGASREAERRLAVPRAEQGWSGAVGEEVHAQLDDEIFVTAS